MRRTVLGTVALLVTALSASLLCAGAGPARARSFDEVIASPWERDWAYLNLTHGYRGDANGDLTITGAPTVDLLEAGDLERVDHSWTLSEDLVGHADSRIRFTLWTAAVEDPRRQAGVTSVTAEFELNYTNPDGAEAAAEITAGVPAHEGDPQPEPTVRFYSSTAPEEEACDVTATPLYDEIDGDLYRVNPPTVTVSGDCFENATRVTVDLALTTTTESGTAVDDVEPFNAGPYRLDRFREWVWDSQYGATRYETLSRSRTFYNPDAGTVTVRLKLAGLYKRSREPQQVITLAESYNDDPELAGVPQTRAESVPVRVKLRKFGRSPIVTTLGPCRSVTAAQSGRMVTVTVPVACYKNQVVLPQWVGIESVLAGSQVHGRSVHPVGVIALR